MNKNDFAKTPPMGWNSYDYYDTTVCENEVKANADYMAKHLKSCGWEYIVVDIQWYAHKAGSKREQFQYIPFSELEMDEYGRLLPDPERFPSSVNGAGFKPLADYIHGLGLKFGIHIMRGIPRIAAHEHRQVKGATQTADQIADPGSICGWNPDMYGVRNTQAGQAYYDSLLELYASWGVDFIKCDDICHTALYHDEPYAGQHEVEMLAKAIEKCGRPVVLSLSPGPAEIEKAWHYETYANMWRITDDFWDDWKLLKNMFYRCELWQKHVSEGCYPDCDMLPLGQVGKGFGQERATRLTGQEQRTMMTLWCLFGSPLMLGAEMTKLDDRTLSLLTNERVLALLPPAVRGMQLCRDEEKAVWTACNTETGESYAALFNLSDETAKVSVLTETVINSLPDIGIRRIFGQDCLKAPLELIDLWEDQSKSCKDEIAKELPAHGCVLYQLCRR